MLSLPHFRYCVPARCLTALDHLAMSPVSNSTSMLSMPKSLHTQPQSQSLYSYDHGSSTWSQIVAPPTQTSLLHRFDFAVLTWNIDFSTPHPKLRLKSALSYLEQLLNRSKPSSPLIVL